MNRVRQCVGISTLAGFLISCGGSSSPSPVNQAPIFTSTSEISVQEGPEFELIYVAAATDPEGDDVTFSMLNEKDSNLFVFDPVGRPVASGFTTQLFFNSSVVPRGGVGIRHEEPRDENGDNVYEITLRARDSNGNTSDLDLAITILDFDPRTYAACRTRDLVQPVFSVNYPQGVPGLFIVEKQGRIRIVREGYPEERSEILMTDFLDISDEVSTDGERGLLGLAFSPDFETDRSFFVSLTNLSGDTEIRKYQTSAGDPLIADESTVDIVLTVPQPRSNHNGGWIGFDDNGYLVVPLGDGGGSGDPDSLAQDPTTLLGKILRIDVTQDDFPADPLRDYGIPPGNTFENDPAAGRAEIFAIGVRNPFRANFDPVSGDLYFGDVGQDQREEVNRLPMDDSSLNFGWNALEGTLEFEGPDSDEFTPPIIEYSHGDADNQGRSVIGGTVYFGDVDTLYAHYVFADFISGHIWKVPIDSLTLGSTLQLTSGTKINSDIEDVDEGIPTRITSISDDLYITTISGELYRLQEIVSSDFFSVIRQCD